METDTQRLTRFHADFEKLKHNREKVPLQQLTTRYARSYNTLVAEVMDGADWFFQEYMKAMAFPTHPNDNAGNAWLAKRLADIEAEEKKTDGLAERYRAALIDRLNLSEYDDLVWQGYERRLQEAFIPYWQRHCRRLESGWIYNDILRKFWWHDDGSWIRSDYTGRDYRYPPQLKEETP